MVGNAAPITESLTINQVISEDTRQDVVRGRITVPDAKPDVDKVLSIDKTVTVKNVSVIPDKVIVEGTLTLQVVYVAFKPDQAVHHMHGKINFTTFVDVPGAQPGMNVKVEVVVEDVSTKRSKTDPRVFDVVAVLDVFAKVTETRDIELVVDVPGFVVEREKIKVDDVIGRGKAQVIVSEEFEVPRDKPPVEKILAVDAKAMVTQTRVVRDKVIVDGEVKVQVMYVALEPNQPVHHMHTTFTFTHFVDVPGAAPNMNVIVDVVVESAEVELKGKYADSLTAYVVLKLDARVTETKQVEIVTSVEGAEFDTRLLHLESVVGEDSTQIVVKESFSTPPPKPDVEKVLDTKVKEVKVTEVKVIKGKVVLRGFIDVNIVYVAFLKDQPVHFMHKRVDFRAFVEIPGADEGMNVQVKHMVEFIKSYYEGCNVHIEIVLKLMVKVTDSMQREVIVSVEGPEKPDVCPPGEVIEYTVQQGDTLFKLAQRYGTTVEAIRDQNPGINPANLRVGQIIRIPCGIVKPKG